MRIPLGWLREYVTWDLPLEALCERLTLGGLEVAGVERIGENWDEAAIRVGRVVQVRQHPDADRLVLVTVDYGVEAPLEVVTGAPNLHVGDVGQKVVFATVGARLIDPYADTLQYKTLKRSKIRGVFSEGMVCSEKELGISDEHTGILLLPEDAPVGMPFAHYWGDTVIEVDLTPNLARCFAIVGVAREVAALTGGTLKLSEPTVLAEGPSIAGEVEVTIAAPELCPRYSAALIRGVHIGPSPLWMQRRLLMCGMRPINNVVDITNYVMLEWGQPLHAFDARWLRPSRPGGPPAIIVRRAQPGERMTTLDGEEHTLTPEMLLITDGGGPVGVAGIMGGLESEVTDATVDVLLEAANFDNISIRRTSAALHIPSEAAQRFGRGVDPELTQMAASRAAELMRTLAGGVVAAGWADVYPRPPAPREIAFRLAEVKRQLGVELSAEHVMNMLASLGFRCQMAPDQPDVVRVAVPSHRLDVTISADLVEEIARLYGYDRLPVTLMDEALPAHPRNLDLELEESVRDLLVGCGLNETVNYSLTNLESVARLTPSGSLPEAEGYIRIANPLSREHEFMRQTLMSTALETMAHNLRFVERVATFEIARVYLPQPGEALPHEPRRLSIGLCGPRTERTWLPQDGGELDFFDLKGIVAALCAHLGLEGVRYAPTQHEAFHPGRVAELIVGERTAGVLGEVHPRVRTAFDLPEMRVCLAELDLEALLATVAAKRRYQPISRMPQLKLDLAIVVDADAAPDAIEATIRETGGTLLENVVLFDVYRGGQLPAGKKSLAYSLTLQAPDRTLTSEQANRQRDRILKALQMVYGAEIRG